METEDFKSLIECGDVSAVEEFLNQFPEKLNEVDKVRLKL